MDDTGHIKFKVYLQLYGGMNKPTEILLTIEPSSVHMLAKHLNLSYVPEITPRGNVCMAENLEVRPEYRTTFSNAHLRNFLYAILHSSLYESSRETLIEVDFSPLQFFGNSEAFWKLESLGQSLIRLHATGFSENRKSDVEFPVVGSNVMVPSEFRFEGESQKLWINKQQYFSNVPAHVWANKTAGMLPLQQWINMYSGCTLNDVDITRFRTLMALTTESLILGRLIDDSLNISPLHRKS